MMLTRRQQFRRCRVRRRGSPVKGCGRRGSTDGGSSYCGSELGSVDALSFRTAHTHTGGDSCGVSPLSSAASSPCPPGSPTLSEAVGGPVGPSTLGLGSESPAPIGPPPAHPLVLTSPVELKFARQGSGESHNSLGSATPSSGSSGGLAARWWHLLGHSTFPSPLAMWSNPAYHAELSSPEARGAVTRPLAKRPSQIVVVETGNSPLPPPEEAAGGGWQGPPHARPALAPTIEELSVCSPAPSPVPAVAPTQQQQQEQQPPAPSKSFGRALLSFFGLGRSRRSSSAAAVPSAEACSGCDHHAAAAAPKPPAGAGALDAGAESDPDSPGSPLTSLVVTVSPLEGEDASSAAAAGGKGASDGSSSASGADGENPATPSTTESDGEDEEEGGGDRGFVRPASPVSRLLLPTAAQEEAAAVAPADPEEGEADVYSDGEEEEEEEGPVEEERGPGHVRFSNVDRLVLIPARCDMDAATHKRLWWCTEEYDGMRRSALDDMRVYNIRNFGTDVPDDFYDEEEGIDADRWGLDEEEEAASETGSVIRHPIPPHQQREQEELWGEPDDEEEEGPELEDEEEDEEATAATSIAAATVSTAASSSSATSASVKVPPPQPERTRTPSPRPTSPILAAALATHPIASPELPPALAFAVKKAAAAAATGATLAMPLPERGLPPRFVGQCSSAPTSRSPSPIPSPGSSPRDGEESSSSGGPAAPLLWGKTPGEAPMDPLSYLSHDAAAHLTHARQRSAGSGGGMGGGHAHHHDYGGKKRGLGGSGCGGASGPQGLVGALDLATAQNRHPPEFLSPPVTVAVGGATSSCCSAEGCVGDDDAGEEELMVGGFCEVSAVDLAVDEILELSRSQVAPPPQQQGEASLLVA